MFKKVLIVNRGAIASRIIRTLKEMEIPVAVVYSEADQHLPYIKQADEAYMLEGNTAQETYLNQDKLISLIKENGIDAVHPGYGFLSENTHFVKKLEEIGVTFIGPSSKYITLMGDKHDARELMSSHGMPIGKGSDVLTDDVETMKKAAAEIGYPVLVKPANGGGGIGMLPVYKEEDLEKTVQRAKGMAEKFFSDGSVYLEKYFEKPRHIEFQIVADQHGNIEHLYERDCSIQRRHQKVIEESPAPGISESEIIELANQVKDSVIKVGYDNVGTVEMIRSNTGDYSFLEMNTRLQVEHAVTEENTGIDLVEVMVRMAAKEQLYDVIPSNVKRQGHTLEVRVYAEDPKTFFPSPGTLNTYQLPEQEGVRIETGFEEGNVISPFYDPMIAKIIVHADNRDQAIERMVDYLEKVKIEGLKSNVPFLLYTLRSEEFKKGDIHTKLAEELVERMKAEQKVGS